MCNREHTKVLPKCEQGLSSWLRDEGLEGPSSRDFFKQIRPKFSSPNESYS